MPRLTIAYRFGRFELRPATRQLLVDERPAALGARAFNLLLKLIERRDRLVGKDELLDLVWPGLVVEENNLQVQVSALRKVLGQEAIATVAGHGYRFTLELMEVGAPSASATAKHNLPMQVASFIGRVRELVDLRDMLARNRCVTLTGVGGIGKTRLALELAATVADGHADGVWFVDLAPVTDQRLVVNAVASTLAVREEPGRPVLETLLKFVHNRPLLLLLDNCEHLLLACAQLTRELLHACQRLTIVATSREPLHVAGEATFPLPTLATPDPRRELSLDALGEYPAVQLFVDRATAARGNFALTRQNAAAVARICHDLDGIPLAIELAAARVRAISAEVIAGHLTHRFRLLKSGDVTALPRQQTLRATIDWSYELLSPPERVLLHRLSVFAGGFTVDGAEAVGAASEVAAEDVLDLFANLVDKSLVAFDAAGDRYRLLETVRQYAQEKLAATGDESQARNEHLRFYADLARRAYSEMRGPRQVTWRARLGAEDENIRVAFAHCRSAPQGGILGLEMVRDLVFCFEWTRFDVWDPVIAGALAHPDAQEATLARSRALGVAAHRALYARRFGEGFALATESVRIARICGDPLTLGGGLFRLGAALTALRREAEALPCLEEGLALTRMLGDSRLEAAFHSSLEDLHALEGRFELAERYGLAAVESNRGVASQDVLATCYCALARDAIGLGSAARATGYLREAAALMGTSGSIRYVQRMLVNCAGLAALRSEWLLAMRLAGAAATHRENTGWGLGPDEELPHARAIQPARDRLGASASDAAFASGHAMSVEKALSEAMAWLEALPAE